MSFRHVALLFALAAATLAAGEVRAEDLSLKVENYIFAASEALNDGEPALALSLLRRAKDEAPDSCIVEEYLCRCYLALGNVEMARGAYGRFVSCMEVSDEGVLAELDRMIVEAEERQRAAPATPPVEPTPPVATVAPAATPTPVAVVPAPQPRRRGAGAAWGLMGAGSVLAAGAGFGAWLTYDWGDYYVVERDKESYETMALYNHAAVIGAGVGGAMVLTGFVIGVSVAGHNHNVAASPWSPSSGGFGLNAQVEF